MYSPANSTFLIHESWNVISPRLAAAPPGPVVPVVFVDFFDELPHAARSADMPPPASNAAPALPIAPRRRKVRRSSDNLSSEFSYWDSSATVPPRLVPACTPGTHHL